MVQFASLKKKSLQAGVATQNAKDFLHRFPFLTSTSYQRSRCFFPASFGREGEKKWKRRRSRQQQQQASNVSTRSDRSQREKNPGGGITKKSWEKRGREKNRGFQPSPPPLFRDSQWQDRGGGGGGGWGRRRRRWRLVSQVSPSRVTRSDCAHMFGAGGRGEVSKHPSPSLFPPPWSFKGGLWWWHNGSQVCSNGPIVHTPKKKNVGKWTRKKIDTFLAFRRRILVPERYSEKKWMQR